MENLPGLDADNFSLGKKFSNVRHSQAVEEVHQDDDGEEDKEDEEDECQEGEGASAVYWQVGELELSNEHCQDFEDACPGTVKVLHPVVVVFVANIALHEMLFCLVARYFLHLQLGVQEEYNS